jgi:hypothetical protein
MYKSLLLTFICFILINTVSIAQNNLVTYAGNEGKETFYDILQLSDGTFIVTGYSDNLNWINNNVPIYELSFSGNIPNALGTNKYGILMHFSNNFNSLLEVVHFPQGAVEDIRFIKTNSAPYCETEDLYISCNTSDTDNNNGGYLLAKLNKNFINGIPSSLIWSTNVWAKSGPKDYHPWDVSSDGRIYYISGEAYGYDWSAIYCLNEYGQRTVVENWRTHWLKNGTEWKGGRASENPNGGSDSVKYSGIVLKVWGRCDLRSWTETEYNTFYEDGNGGTRKGKWPADVLFSGPCDPLNPSANGPGYTGYSSEACCPVWGGNSIVVDRRNGNFYIGMSFKSYFNPQNTPDFEPAVIAMSPSGEMTWWSRLYHEITPQGDTVGSIPDQYIDALAIDYQSNKLVVGARTHGNNTQNFWNGNVIENNPQAFGFQNQFTGTNGDIHLSWLGKLQLTDGKLANCTYMGEMTESTGSIGTPHPDPNLDGWSNPNTGWPNVNTTRMAKNNIKVTSSGDVCVLSVGRRTITTANAYQKMVKPTFGGKSCWNSFVRIYDNEFHVPKYSSLIVGAWDTLTQEGGANTEMFGVFKTAQGVVAVGRHTANVNGISNGNNLPVINVPEWGANTPQNESAILVYYKSENLFNPNDSSQVVITTTNKLPINNGLSIYPTPTSNEIKINLNGVTINNEAFQFSIFDQLGRLVLKGTTSNQTIYTGDLNNGTYYLKLANNNHEFICKMVVIK